MSKKIFIEEVEKFAEQLSDEALTYFNEFKSSKASKEGITESGKKILEYMQNNYSQCDNIFSAKNIGEGLFTSGRSISGSMRKLLTDGYVEKISTSPVKYSLTDLGKTYKFDK
jgi:hypothetical protein